MSTLWRSRHTTDRWYAAGPAIVLLLLLTGCTGRGGGVLPADLNGGFDATANIGFAFSCEGGRLSLSLEYHENGTYAAGLGEPFSIHGRADQISPVLESYFCVGESSNGALPAGEILFQGAYTSQSGSPRNYDEQQCEQSIRVSNGTSFEEVTGCRFTARVSDTGVRGPSNGDSFSIELFGGPDTGGTLYTVPPIYSRAGTLEKGNFEVDNS